MAHAEIFHLDPEVLLRTAKMYAAFANAVAGNAENARMLKASSLVIAASYFSLVDPSEARKCFELAAAQYGYLNNPYYSILAVCSTTPDRFHAFEKQAIRESDTEPQLLADDFFYRLTYNYSSRSKNIDSMIENEDGFLKQVVGRLRLPLNLYTNVYHAASDTKSSRTELAPIVELLNRVSEITLQAMQDRFHWQRLQLDLLPIEPEILATVLNILQRRTSTRYTIDTGIQHPTGSSYIEVAFDLLRHK